MIFITGLILDGINTADIDITRSKNLNDHLVPSLKIKKITVQKV